MSILIVENIMIVNHLNQVSAYFALEFSSATILLL